MTTAIMQPIATRQTFLPYALPTIGEDEINEVADSLRSGWITTGPKVKRFEGCFADYIGTRHAIAVSSCTDGLHLALAALGIGAGDEVILPTFTFCSTANVVVHLGARPILVDVGTDCNITSAAIEAAITPKTKAIMPVHYGGQACDLDAIYAIAAEHDLAVVEDCAHAVGADYDNIKIGADTLQAAWPNLRRLSVFSFYATKNMTTGEGGMVTTANAQLAETVRLLTLHGMSRDAWKRYTSAGSWYYEVVAAGYKDNMTDIQAALGIHQLARLDSFIAARQSLARCYDDAFAGVSEIKTPIVHRDRTHIYHIYHIQLDPTLLSIDRAQFIEELKAYNIGTSVHFIPVHLHPFYQQHYGYRSGDLPTAESIYNQIISLPLYPRMEQADIEYVINCVSQIIEQQRS